MNTDSKQKSSWQWRQSGVFLALLAALFTAFIFTIDTQVMTNVIKHDQRLIAVLVYLTLGSWIGVVFNYIYNHLFARHLDPTFTRERVFSGKSGLYVMAAGVSAGLGTFSYLFVAGKGDPSVLIALSTLSVVYLALYDGVKTRGTKLLKGTLAALMCVTGVALVSYTGTLNGTAQTIPLTDILLVAVAFSGFDTVAMICMGKLAEAKEDMVSAAFWRFFWLSVTATVLSPIVASSYGYFSEYARLMGLVFWKAFPWVLLLMFFAYGGNVLTALAQKFEKASTVKVVKNTQSLLAVPLTLLFAWLLPDMFDVPAWGPVWVWRMLGGTLIMLAIWLVPKKKKDEDS